MTYIICEFPTKSHLQDFINEYNSDRVKLVSAKRKVHEKFLERLYDSKDISEDELRVLSLMCKSGRTADHCIYCEAWNVLISMEDD